MPVLELRKVTTVPARASRRRPWPRSRRRRRARSDARAPRFSKPPGSGFAYHVRLRSGAAASMRPRRWPALVSASILLPLRSRFQVQDVPRALQSQQTRTTRRFTSSARISWHTGAGGAGCASRKEDVWRPKPKSLNDARGCLAQWMGLDDDGPQARSPGSFFETWIALESLSGEQATWKPRRGRSGPPRRWAIT